MNTSYIYSATRLNTLGTLLLSQTDIDRLLVATPGDELQQALKETYLAPYVLETKDEDVTEAIEATMVEAKDLISRIAPDSDLFAVLWVMYDIHNLRVFAKATRTGVSLADVLPSTSRRGMYDPEALYAHVEASTLNRVQIDWQTAYDEALHHVEAGELDQVDAVFDRLLFTTIGRSGTASSDAFVKRYVAAVIDLYNLKATLRQARLSTTRFAPAFISGGTFAEAEVAGKDGALAAFEVLAPGYFKDALEDYEVTGNTSQLDARTDDYLVSLAKSAATDMFSSASLVLYYLRARQAATNIRTIVVGRSSGQSTDAIRANLRTAYVNN